MAATDVSQRFSFDAVSARLTENTATGVNTLFGWPVIHAFRWSAATGKSVSFQPEIAILPERRSVGVYRFEQALGLNEQDQLAIETYLATIPPRIRGTIATLADRQWEVLVWAARGGLAAEDLLVSNPMIAFALANLAEVLPTKQSGRTVETQQRLLPSRKQREILERLDFEPTERVRRILRKVMPGSINLATLVLLRDQLRKPAVSERLAHVPAIGPQVLAMIDNGTFDYVTLAALEAFACADARSEDHHMATLVENAARIWCSELVSRARTPCGDQLAQAARKTDFPPAPFLGTEAIVPILYRGQLLEEACEQNNCVFDYAPQVARGKIAIYRVLFPERCTLSLKLRQGHWTVDQLKGWRNREPGADVAQVVAQWLETRSREARLIG